MEIDVKTTYPSKVGTGTGISFHWNHSYSRLNMYFIGKKSNSGRLKYIPLETLRL